MIRRKEIEEVISELLRSKESERHGGEYITPDEKIYFGVMKYPDDPCEKCLIPPINTWKGCWVIDLHYNTESLWAWDSVSKNMYCAEKRQDGFCVICISYV